MEFRFEVHRRSVRWLDGQADLDRYANIMLVSAMAKQDIADRAVDRAMRAMELKCQAAWREGVRA
jgi:hypothetical protein